MPHVFGLLDLPVLNRRLAFPEILHDMQCSDQQRSNRVSTIARASLPAYLLGDTFATEAG
ncbi:MAG: hypothetical protein P4L76_03720 [Beijerinckiaceae bacterium]|nr:hypothetical protein [Beijerinckiaceae bacterium]